MKMSILLIWPSTLNKFIEVVALVGVYNMCPDWAIYWILLAVKVSLYFDILLQAPAYIVLQKYIYDTLCYNKLRNALFGSGSTRYAERESLLLHFIPRFLVFLCI